MRPPNASRAAWVYAALGLALVAGALFAPWFWAEHSSGRQTPPKGMQPPSDTGVQRQTLSDTPPRTTESGDFPVADPAAHQQWLNDMAYLSWAAIGLYAIVVLGEVPGIRNVVPRGVSLAASGLAVLASGGALAIGWFLLPGTVGVGTTPYAAALRDDWYWRSSLDWGYYVAAVGAPMGIASFLAKYQAGWQESSAVERHILPTR